MQRTDKYNVAFQQALATLNGQQCKAVEQIEGPVLVIAGPGTGKTQILAARIGKILTETDTGAHSILCLTYTDAGTVAMRKRLFGFIGPDAYHVHIYTFHSFCNDIIQKNLDYFGKYSLEPISDLEKIELFKELVDAFPAGHVLKRFRGDVYYEIPRLQNLFSVMKREDWPSDLISKKIDEYLEEVRNSEVGSSYYKDFKYAKKYRDKNAGDLKPSFDMEAEKMEILRAAAGEFKNYTRLMMEHSRYDYDDMILWVLDAFKEDENFLLNYQEKYQYVLVDEFQDTSGTQNELIQLLISYWDKPNIFVVGDDDQSIFRFQGANVENIMEFAKAYERDLYKVVLTDNYRSSQHILDISKKLIDKNTVRLTTRIEGLDKNLTAKNTLYAGLATRPEMREYDTAHHEFAHLTGEISQLISQGVAASEIAVIYREHRLGEQISQYFQLQGIPVNAKRKADLLKVPFAQKILNILRYLVQENDIPYSGDALLFEIMHYDFYDISPIEIAKIFKTVDDDRKKNFQSVRHYLHEHFLKKNDDLFSQSTTAEIRRLISDLEYWVKEYHNITLQKLFEKIIVRGGILRYIMNSEEKMWLMQVLTALFDFLKEENRRNPDMKPEQFISTIDLIEKNKLTLDLNQALYNEEGVNFLTCHGSKGLEFEYVYLVGCNAEVWEGKKKSSGTYKFPGTIFSEQHLATDEEELRRLFYVAMTRAKSHLSISYPAMRSDGKLMEASLFVSEIIAETDLVIQKIKVEAGQLFNYLALQFAEEEQPEIGLIDKQFIDKYLENYSLSVTHLSNYLNCPLKFYFQNLICVPAGKSESMEFGSAVHHALQRLFTRMLADENRDFPLQNVFVEDFKWYMQRHRESFTKEEFKRRMEYGEKILPAYYDHYITKWNKIAVTERRINNVQVKGVPIKGVLDKLEFTGKMVNVVDYKTGNYDRAKEKLKRPDEKQPDGGDYWRQAVFYKILVDNDRSNDWKVASSEFDFVEPIKDDYKTTRIEITDEDVQVVTQQITEVYTKIKNHEFSKGCGKEDCEWCAFVRTNYRTIGELQND